MNQCNHGTLDHSQPDGTNATLHSPISGDGTSAAGLTHRIPARHGRAVKLKAGQSLRIVNTHGTQVCDLWAFTCADSREYLSMEHVHTFLSRITLRKGDDLVTNRRRPILTLVEDTSPGVHDTLIAACDLARYRQLGIADYHDNCADNLRMALLAIGHHTAEIPSPLNLFMNTPASADGDIAWLPPVCAPGDYVVLKAAIDCVVVMSACPQDIVPINGEATQPADLEFSILQ